MNLVAEVVLELLLRYFLLPIVWVVTTPFILVFAFFRKKHYWSSVAEMNSSVTKNWL